MEKGNFKDVLRRTIRKFVKGLSEDDREVKVFGFTDAQAMDLIRSEVYDMLSMEDDQRVVTSDEVDRYIDDTMDSNHKLDRLNEIKDSNIHFIESVPAKDLTEEYIENLEFDIDKLEVEIKESELPITKFNKSIFNKIFPLEGLEIMDIPLVIKLEGNENNEEISFEDTMKEIENLTKG